MKEKTYRAALLVLALSWTYAVVVQIVSLFAFTSLWWNKAYGNMIVASVGICILVYIFLLADVLKPRIKKLLSKDERKEK